MSLFDVDTNFFSGKVDTKSIIGHALYGIAIFLKTTEVELI